MHRFGAGGRIVFCPVKNESKRLNNNMQEELIDENE